MHNIQEFSPQNCNIMRNSEQGVKNGLNLRDVIFKCPTLIESPFEIRIKRYRGQLKQWLFEYHQKIRTKTHVTWPAKPDWALSINANLVILATACVFYWSPGVCLGHLGGFVAF